MAESIKQRLQALNNNVVGRELKKLWDAARTELAALRTLSTELRTDHATFKTAADQTETLIEELHDDHATFKTALDQTETLIEELHDDHATNKTILDELKADFNLLRANLFNCALGNAGWAEGTNATTIKTVNAIDYCIDGVIFTKAATDNIAFTATAQQAVSTFCLYLFSIDSAGTVTVTKGTELGTDTAVLPARPASSAVIGAVKVATDGATTFTGGTTDLGAAGITDTYLNLMFANTGVDAATAIAASSAATLTAPKPASAPATLTAPKPASAPATITAAAVSESLGE